jgi:hypothetical protein
MPPAILGVHSTGNGPSLSNKIDMSKLYLLEPEASPLVTLTQRLNKVRTVTNPQYHTQALRPLAQETTSQAYLVGATTIVVTDSTIFNVGDTLQNQRTFENMLITAINYGTHTLTVTRAAGTTAAAAGNLNDILVRIGQASAEGAGMPESNLASEEHIFNYTQIFRESFKINGTFMATDTYTGDKLKLKAAQVARKIKGDMEMAFLYGERWITGATTSAPRRKTAGLRAHIVTNSYNPAGTMTEAQFLQNFIAPVFRVGNNPERVLLCGETILRCLHNYATSKMNIFQEDNTLGFKCMRYISPYGDLLVVRHPLMRNARNSQTAFAIDPNNISRVVLKGRDLGMQPDRQANDIDGYQAEMLAECGLEVALEETHGILDGVTGPA